MGIVLASTIDIDATREDVWDVLSDLAAYGEWSNFSRITGSPELGTELRMRMPGFHFTSTVTAVTEARELQWSAALVTSGLFLGRHTFTLSLNRDGTTRLHNTEVFTGVLTKPFEGMFAKSHTQGGYAAFNQSLKNRVETRIARRPLHAQRG